MHLKNFSLRETEPASRQFRLAEAYDLLPVQLILPEDEEQMALTLNGKNEIYEKKILPPSQNGVVFWKNRQNI